MIGHDSYRSRSRGRSWPLFIPIVAVLSAAGCSPHTAPASASPTVLRIGFGQVAGASETAGLRAAISNLTSEGLLIVQPDGRIVPWLAQSWSQSDDGRTVRIQLRPNATFHNGQPVDSATVASTLSRRLPGSVGPAASEIESVTATSPTEVQIALRNRSNFVLEGLDLGIAAPDAARSTTGPFVPTTENGAQILVRNDRYYGGPASIDRIEFHTYSSVRAAWADSLRGDVDMLYEVGVDAINSLEGSTQTRVFNIRRPYGYTIVLNTRMAALRDPAVRRGLNAAIDRERLVTDIFAGHGTPAYSPAWPLHWAYDQRTVKFSYKPEMVSTSDHRLQLTCLLADASLERLALAIQNQLSAVGVDMKFEVLPLDEFSARAVAGQFEAILGDVVGGPAMLRPSLLWHSTGSNNWGHYSNPAVDAAIDGLNRAENDTAYKKAFADFQRALVDDPPAIFLTWIQRARAVSTRYEVPSEPGREILRNLRLWRQLAPPPKTLAAN